MGWEHYQTVDLLKKEPQVGRGLFGVRFLILHFKFQFSKSWTFHFFLNLTYPLRKNISFTKCQKITPKFTQKRKTLVNVNEGFGVAWNVNEVFDYLICPRKDRSLTFGVGNITLCGRSRQNLNKLPYNFMASHCIRQLRDNFDQFLLRNKKQWLWNVYSVWRWILSLTCEILVNLTI